jgi:hypothetical protein
MRCGESLLCDWLLREFWDTLQCLSMTTLGHPKIPICVREED